MQDSKNKRRIFWAVVILVLSDFPQWLASVWSLFTAKPLYLWLQEKGITMPHFSLLWITWPTGLFLLGILVFNSIREGKERTRLKIIHIDDTVEKVLRAEKLKEKSEADKSVATKQFAKKELSGYLLKLQERLNNAMNTSRFEFKDDLKDKEWQTTKELFARTEAVLKALLSDAESSIFRIAGPKPPPEPKHYDVFTFTIRDWQWQIDCIISKRDELKRIIERLG